MKQRRTIATCAAINPEVIRNVRVPFICRLQCHVCRRKRTLYHFEHPLWLGNRWSALYLSSAWPCAIGHWNLLDIYHCTADMINCSVSLKSTMTTKSIDACSRFLIKLVWNFLLFWCQHALWPLLRRSTFVNEIFSCL